MRCRSCLAALPEFLAGELPKAGSAALRAHLKDCHACRQQAARWQQSRKALRSLAGEKGIGESAGGSPAWFAGLQRDIVARIAAEPVPAGEPRGRRPRWALVLLSSAAMLLLGWYWLPSWWLVAPTTPAIGERWQERASLALPTTVGNDARGAGARWSDPVPQWPRLLLLGSESRQLGAGLQHRYRLRLLAATEADPGDEPGWVSPVQPVLKR